MPARATPLVHVFTDGACSGNPGPGGWAYIVRDDATGRESGDAGAEEHTTNNRMELRAVIRGLESLPERHRVILSSDSQYVVKGISEWMAGWKARGWRRGKQLVKNQDLWQEIDRLCARHDVQAEWVRGHSDHPENERCDRMAVGALEGLRIR